MLRKLLDHKAKKCDINRFLSFSTIFLQVLRSPLLILSSEFSCQSCQIFYIFFLNVPPCASVTFFFWISNFQILFTTSCKKSFLEPLKIVNTEIPKKKKVQKQKVRSQETYWRLGLIQNLSNSMRSSKHYKKTIRVLYP